MESIDSLGFLEVFGFTAGIEGADAMLKSAQVRLICQHEVSPGLITLIIEGDLASCRAAVNAGKAAAARVGMVIGSHVIGRPDEDTESMILKYIPQSSAHYRNDDMNSAESEKHKIPDTVAPKIDTPVKVAAPMSQSIPSETVELVQPETVAEESNNPAILEKNAQAIVPKRDLYAPVIRQAEKAMTPVAKKAITQAEFEKVIEYITAVAKGRSWQAIKLHFPHDPEQLLNKLNEVVTSGRIIKVRASYRKAEAKRSS